MAAIVDFRDEHATGVIALIASIFAEYRLTFDIDDYDADLTRIHATYRGAGGAFWVLEDDGRVVGTVAVVPLSPAEAEIKRVYLDAALRGRGWGRTLTEHAIGWAVAHGHSHARVWSDVRFDRAHVMYQRLGFTQTGMRDCDDIDKSREYGFEKTLP
jgi:putative acetyltransferase